MTSQPQVAIVVLCRNEEKFIAACLDSLLANDYDQQLLDIVVVDGMSTDRTREIVGEYCRNHSNVRMVDNPNKRTPFAFNVGIKATTAEVVMPIASHSAYPSNYVSKLVDGLDRYQADNIGGLLVPQVGPRAWDRAVACVYGHSFAAGNAQYRTASNNLQPRRVGTVFCGCYRRKVFEQIGYFNEKLTRGQDREFNDRLTQHGGVIMLDPTVKCHYCLRTGLISYAQWMFRGGFWVFYAQRFTQTKMLAWRNWIPPLFVLWHLAPLICGLFSRSWLLLSVAPIAAYWLLNLLVSIRTAWQKREPLFVPYLVLLFALTHYTYGVGAICGWFMAKLRGKMVKS